jgi:SSS family solute:Na+ symporter
MPEFLEKRYSPAARTYLSAVSIFAYVATKISVTIFAGALVFEVMLGVPFWAGAALVVIATGIYTIYGGLRAVIYTDMIQMFILVFGSIAVTYFGLQAIGGWSGVTETISATHGAESSKFFNLWRPMDDPDFPWTGVLFGAPILGVWYWCTDQFIVQRVLSAKNISEARKGTLFGGFMKLLPIFLFVIPGVIAYAIYLKVDPTLLHNSAGEMDGDTALPALVMNFLPTGFKGLVVAGLLAALMSSLSSVFNSCSTLFTLDFYKKWYPESTEAQLVKVGRIATVVLVISGLMWIPLMKMLTEGGGIYKYLQSIQAYISPPIAAVFLIGLFSKRINAKGAIASLMTGLVIGSLRLILEAVNANGGLAEGGALQYFATINFLHFALFLFLLCALVLVAVSLTAPAHSAEKLKNVTYERIEEHQSIFSNRDFWLTISLIVLVIVIWIVFSPYGVA